MMAADEKKTDPHQSSDFLFDDDVSPERWLEKNPGEWAKAIAARIGLRVLPLIGVEKTGTGFSNSDQLHRVLPLFRMGFISWAVCRYPGYHLNAAADDSLGHISFLGLSADSGIDHVGYAIAIAAKAESE